MSKHLRIRWKHGAIAVALLVGSAGVVATAFAGPGGDPAGTESATSASPSSSNPSAARKANPAAPAPPPAVLAELDELKQTVQAQVQKIADRTQELESEQANLANDLDRIAKLEAELGVAPATAAVSPSPISPSLSPDVSAPAVDAIGTIDGIAVASPDAAVPQEDQTTGSVDKRLTDLEARLKKVGPLSVSGDFRFRDESFTGGPTNGSLDQDRLRIRLRVNADVDLGDGVSGGFAFASGDVNNPISTNTDITSFYTRKPFEIDRAYAQYNPTFFKPLTLVGGKFAYPWFNTELTWDKDINPEGAAETLAFDLHNTPVLKRFALIGFELPFAQVSGVNLANQSLVQSVTYGGQAQAVFKLTHWATFSAFEGFYDFRNADPIALALAKAVTKNPVTPFSGLLPLTAGNTTQNSIVTTTATSIVTVGGVTAPTGVSTVTNAQFKSKFALLDSIAKLDFKTPSERWPVTFIGDFVQNTEACANEKNILAAPVNTATATYSQSTNFACNARQRHGYWGEVEVGRILAKHDLQFGYTRIVIEREAVLSNFDYSEIRQGSNVTEHRASVFYTVKDNVVLDFIALIGRPLNESRPTVPEPFLNRLQFDVNYAF